RRIRDDDCVGCEEFFVRLDERLQILAANFFLALGEDDDVDGKRATRGEMRFERLDVEEQLAFSVHWAAREDLAVAHRGLERRAIPELERLGGVHVVMTVNEDG